MVSILVPIFNYSTFVSFFSQLSWLFPNFIEKIKISQSVKYVSGWFCAPALAGRVYLLPPQYYFISNDDFSTNMGKNHFSQ